MLAEDTGVKLSYLCIGLLRRLDPSLIVFLATWDAKLSDADRLQVVVGGLALPHRRHLALVLSVGLLNGRVWRASSNLLEPGATVVSHGNGR